MTAEETPAFGPFDAAEVTELARHMRGIRQAVLRVVGEHPAMEAALVDLLLAMGVSVHTGRVDAIAPPPTRRIGVRYVDTTAVITLVVDIDRRA